MNDYEKEYLENEYKCRISEDTREGLTMVGLGFGAAVALTFSLFGPLLLVMNSGRLIGLAMTAYAVLYWYYFFKLTGDDYC